MGAKTFGYLVVQGNILGAIRRSRDASVLYEFRTFLQRITLISVLGYLCFMDPIYRYTKYGNEEVLSAHHGVDRGELPLDLHRSVLRHSGITIDVPFAEID